MSGRLPAHKGSAGRCLSTLQSSARRQGSALILVVTVLGILFVTGVAFMASMNFDAQNIGLEQQASRQRNSLRAISSATNQIGTKSLVHTPGSAPGAATIGTAESVTNFAGQTYNQFTTNTLTAVELPVVHGMFSPIEPYMYTPDVGMDPRPIWAWYTDLDRMINGPVDDEGARFDYFRHIDTRDSNFNVVKYGPNVAVPYNPYVADADGDGIVDSILVDMERLGVPKDQIGEIARTVNPPTGRPEKAFVGVRIVPHGGMVNLSEAHPNLIANLMNNPARTYAATFNERPGPYQPAVEESSLRRRFILPAKSLPVTALQGNPFDLTDADIPGGGHFATYLFPEGESLASGYRYWPFMPYSDSEPDDYLTWVGRMDPTMTSYDLRHLVTTVSHSDLLMKPTQVRAVFADASGAGVFVNVDAVQRMREASNPGGSNCTQMFEYVDYPQTIRNGPTNLNWCQCLDATTNPTCRVDYRKGRLRLSFKWLDEAYRYDYFGDDVPKARQRRIELIQDAFMLMLLNARGTDWGSVIQAGQPNAGEWMYTPEQLGRLEFTAASLTANMLDFADQDDKPTAVLVRSMNFADASVVGRPVQDANGADRYVYGLERQPFITEIAAQVVGDGMGGLDPMGNQAYAVEVFNPNNVAFPTMQQATDGLTFGLRVSHFPDSMSSIPIGNIPAGGFLVAKNDEGGVFGTVPGSFEDSNLTFKPNDVIYLTLEWQEAGQPVRVVVDQFTVSDPIARPVEPPTLPSAFTHERPWNDSPEMAGATTRSWFFPIPAAAGTAHEVVPAEPHSLGLTNFATDRTLRPVQVLFANNAPNRDDTNPNTSTLWEAFPTTGSLLLLMRYANKSITENVTDGKFAFTAYLDAERTKLDNGRMPLYDVVTQAGAVPRHYNHPWTDFYTDNIDDSHNIPGDGSQLPWGQLVFDYFTALPLSNPGPWASSGTATDPAATPRIDREGLRVHGRIDINAAPWRVLSGVPLIPMASIEFGIPANSALLRAAIRKGAGLVAPTAGNQLFPDPSNPNEVVVMDAAAGTIGEPLAQSIVAYREIRQIQPPGGPPNPGTGNYDLDPPVPVIGQPYVGRGWNVNGPTLRRGTGFLSVGELANVRHPFASPATSMAPYIAGLSDFSFYRTDGGVIGNSTNQEDYLSAVALLVALSDWVDVRSHVYTVYGTVWGDPEGLNAGVTIAELESRAIRFQETMDRLDTFIGAQAPSRIGERTTARYKDINGG